MAAYGDTRILEDVDPSGATKTYIFGCGNCHPLDVRKHMDGNLQVELFDSTAPQGSIKSSNPLPNAGTSYAGAKYNQPAKTCSDVYCHSSGHATGSVRLYRQSPAWTSTTKLGCNGCHDNPPKYPSGGPGAADANSHLQWDPVEATEWGHFMGLHGTGEPDSHGRYAAPITCQTCHSQTVDPAATGRSGFYWLNTTGSYTVQSDPGYKCTDCHGNSTFPWTPTPTTGNGGVLPLKHVNGKRDVRFDDRRLAPQVSGWVPTGGNGAPIYAFWTDPSGMGWTVDICTSGPNGPPCSDGRTSFTGSTWSLYLVNSYNGQNTYDAANKTCLNISCHLNQVSVKWGTDYNDTTTIGREGCNACHQY
jgi:predicted CxxxxCH...CXXCH cytochrome family protein